MRRNGPGGTAAWSARAVGGALAANVALAALGRSIVREGGDPRIGVVIGLIALQLAGAGVVALLAAVSGRSPPGALGLRGTPPLRAAGLVVATFVGFAVLSATWMVAFGGDEDAVDVTDRLAAGASTANAVLVLMLLGVAVPLSEELLFRGCLFRALEDRRGFWPAAVASSIVFAGTHVGWVPAVALTPVALLGLAACLLYRWTGSLYPALAMHALLNATSTGVALEWGTGTALAVAVSIAATLALARLIVAALGDGTVVRAR